MRVFCFVFVFHRPYPLSRDPGQSDGQSPLLLEAPVPYRRVSKWRLLFRNCDLPGAFARFLPGENLS